MVKLTADLIEQSAQYTNAIRDRELDLRGYKIPVIENLGASLILRDFNMQLINFKGSLQIYENKLQMKVLLKSRVENIWAKDEHFLAHLRTKCSSRVGEGLDESIPNLDSLIMSNNSLQELGDLDHLSNFKNLTHLSLLRNPVATKKHYRLYIINKVPSLRVLDFQRVRLKEKEAAAKMFKGKKGQALASDIGKKSKTFVPGEGIPEPKKGGPSKEDVAAIKLAIANAKTLEEVERLNNMLKTGQIPGKVAISKSVAGEEEEEMETNGT